MKDQRNKYLKRSMGENNILKYICVTFLLIFNYQRADQVPIPKNCNTSEISEKLLPLIHHSLADQWQFIAILTSVILGSRD